MRLNNNQHPSSLTMQEQILIWRFQVLHNMNFFTLGRWEIRTAIAAFIISLFTAFPSYDAFFKSYAQNEELWIPIARQMESPFTFTNYDKDLHAANTSFRLTLPVMGYLCGLSSSSIKTKIIFSLIIETVALYFLLFYFLSLCFTLIKDKTSSILLTFAFSLTYTANCLPSDLYGGYDSIAYLFLAIALTSKNPIVLFSSVFLASFTDERALIASSLVLLFHWLINKDNLNLKSLRPGTVIAILLSWIVYFTCRYLLTLLLGFETNSHTASIGWIVLIEAVNNIPIGIYSGLEGFWILVLLGIILMYLQKEYFLLLIYTGLLILITIVSFWILDITRSMAYIFPALFIGLWVVMKRSNINFIQSLSIAILFICLFPTYYIYGQNTIKWLFPLPLQAIRWIMGNEAFTTYF